jgi:hypothetical protein
MRATQRVPDLLALKAACPGCGDGLIETGLRMRQGLDDWASYVALIELMIHLEEKFSLKLTDEDVGGVKTLRDLVAIVESHLQSPREAKSQAVDLVTAAAREVGRIGLFPWKLDSDGELDFDVPLVKLFLPNRWDADPLTRS